MTTKSLGLIGVGAFGALAAKHLAPHFDLVLCDASQDLTPLAQTLKARIGALQDAASCDIVILAVPLPKFRQILIEISPFLGPNTLVLDVVSVKIKPAALMLEILPSHIAVVGTHPLFGPQSGKNGIAGLNIAVCDIRGGRGKEVVDFCATKLALHVFETTAEEHDREAAYVLGLTHMIAKMLVSLDLPKFKMTTKTYELLDKAVDFVRYDSEELFRTIERENPFVEETKKAFFAAARRLERKLSEN